MLGRWIKNWRTLRRALNDVAAEREQWPYESLDRSAEDLPAIERLVDGRPFWFQLERWEKKPNGDLVISIDARGLPTILGVKPSYQFAKRIDGSVYYP